MGKNGPIIMIAGLVLLLAFAAHSCGGKGLMRCGSGFVVTSGQDCPAEEK